MRRRPVALSGIGERQRPVVHGAWSGSGRRDGPPQVNVKPIAGVPPC